VDLLNIAMVSSEMAPLAKTGGLADVLAALPVELAQRGHFCSVFLPAFRSVLRQAKHIEDLHIGFPISLGHYQVAARVFRTTLLDGKLPVYLIDQPQFFDRDFLYGDQFGDYQDNCARFVFFNRAVIEAIRRLRLPVDVIHCHDWQAGLIPAYIKTQTERLDGIPQPATVTTIHNLAYQGRFWTPDFPMTGLSWDTFTADGVEFYNDLCFLKAGIVYADQITTVSPNYAREIQTAAHGCGLEGVLSQRSNRLTGIVNGVDYDIWDPKHDPHIPKRFDPSNWSTGKAVCKSALQNELGLSTDTDRPLIGLVGRFASQKGWDITIPVIERWLEQQKAQWAILGSGDPRFQDWLMHVRSRFSNHISVSLTFSEPLAHRIEAASDIFLMPSQYEPCGLNQLYSLRYGSVPVVHAVGGLVDTVRDFREENDAKEATGFLFDSYNSDALDNRLSSAVDLYHSRADVWSKLVVNGMSQDWSWTSSASEYERVYAAALSSVRT
jgi:starch synthase